MKIRISSVTSGEVGNILNKYTTAFEDRLRPIFLQKDYGAGVEQLSIFFISVGDDYADNEPFCKMHNKTGKYKELFSDKKIRYVSIAVLLEYATVLKLQNENLFRYLVDKLISTLNSPEYKMPKNFDHKKLLEDLKDAFTKK